MAKMTIFVPDDLYARITQLRETGLKPNWSRVASDAIEAAYSQLIKSTKNMPNLTAVLLPVPTAGDYSLFEARVHSESYRVKVSGTVMAMKTKAKLERIVAEFARRIVSKHRSLDPGSVLPETLVSHIAEQIESEM